MVQAPDRLCLLRLSALGDVTHVVPVVRTLQRVWPETELTWIVGRTEARLVGDLPGVEFIEFDKSGGLRAYRDLRATLRGRRFDALLHMQVALRANLAALCVHARRRIGFDRARSRDGHGLFVNERIAAQPRAHVIDGFFGFLEQLGIDQRDLRWDLPIPDDVQAFVDRQLGADDDAWLAINPCTSARVNNWRNWSAERYAAVIEHAATHHGLRTVLTGGPTDIEREMAAAIRAQADAEVLDLVGQTSPKGLLAVMARARAAIAPDTGPLHIAAAAGTPVIGLFATSNPDRTGPVRGREWTVNRYPEAVREAFGVEVDALRWGRRVRDPEAMRRIRVTDVTRRLDALLTGGAPPAL
jgi:heptosyltransferase I